MGEEIGKTGNLDREAVYRIRELFAKGREADLFEQEAEMEAFIRQWAKLALYPEIPLLSFGKEGKRTEISVWERELFWAQKKAGQGQFVRKLIVCGGVDDGKSTLIGRILFETKSGKEREDVCTDPLYLRKDGSVDYALLAAATEKEARQGITVEASYSFFSWQGSGFLMADAPGHEEYTHHMAAAAAKMDLAVLVLAANKGIVPQTRRHARICYFMGIRRMVFAINKMDMVSYGEAVFHQISKEVEEMMEEYGDCSYQIVPIAAKEGENMTKPSAKMDWRKNLPLLAVLKEGQDIKREDPGCFCMAVQRICKPSQMAGAKVAKRVIQGEVIGGELKQNDPLFVYPTGQRATVSKIYVLDKESETAHFGDVVGIELDRELDVARGYILSGEDILMQTDRIEADLLWMSENRLSQGSRFQAEIGAIQVPAAVTKIYYQTDVNTGERRHTGHLTKNAMARCELYFPKQITAACEKNNRKLGTFCLRDLKSQALAACGNITHMISGEAWKEEASEVSKEEREDAMGQKAGLILFSGSENMKKRINYIERHLLRMGFHTVQTESKGGLQKLLDAGLIVLAALQPTELTEVKNLFLGQNRVFDYTKELESDEKAAALLKLLSVQFL